MSSKPTEQRAECRECGGLGMHTPGCAFRVGPYISSPVLDHERAVSESAAGCANHCGHDPRWMGMTQSGLQCLARVEIHRSDEDPYCGHVCESAEPPAGEWTDEQKQALAGVYDAARNAATSPEEQIRLGLALKGVSTVDVPPAGDEVAMTDQNKIQALVNACGEETFGAALGWIHRHRRADAVPQSDDDQCGFPSCPFEIGTEHRISDHPVIHQTPPTPADLLALVGELQAENEEIGVLVDHPDRKRERGGRQQTHAEIVTAIKDIKDDNDHLTDVACDQEDKIRELTAEVERLRAEVGGAREAIAIAPHNRLCNYILDEDDRCNCWKAAWPTKPEEKQ